MVAQYNLDREVGRFVSTWSFTDRGVKQCQYWICLCSKYSEPCLYLIWTTSGCGLEQWFEPSRHCPSPNPTIMPLGGVENTHARSIYILSWCICRIGSILLQCPNLSYFSFCFITEVCDKLHKPKACGYLSIPSTCGFYPNGCHIVDIPLFRMCLYGAELQFHFTGTKRSTPSQASWCLCAQSKPNEDMVGLQKPHLTLLV